jgi:hypothetical protein
MILRIGNYMASDPAKGLSSSDPLKGSPDLAKTSNQPHQKIKAVEAVGEVDPDQQSKARKFREMVEAEPEDSSTSQLPSPLDLFTSGSGEKPKMRSAQGPSAPEDGAEAIPSPAYSAPPAAAAHPTTGKEERESPLPHSDDFWSDIDEPTQKPGKTPQFVETSLKGPKGKQRPKGSAEEFIPSSHLGIPIKEPSLSPPAKNLLPSSPAKKEEALFSPPPQLPEEKKTSPKERPATPMGRPLSPEGEKKKAPPPSHFTSKPSSAKEKTLEEERPKTKENLEAVFTPPPQEDLPQSFEEGKGSSKKKPAVDDLIPSPSNQPLPAQIIPIATAATAAAMPYLKPETLSLFYQMVGTIYVAAQTPGVTRTEVVLNSLSYTQSKFYGASIIIEKYASAPDSFNIRLTGSNEAVNAFNQNIPSLLSAFQRGNFSFNIGRIEAEYRDEKPIFRRKEGKKGSDLGGDFTNENR